MLTARSFLPGLAALLGLLDLASAAPHKVEGRATWNTLTDVTVYTPASNYTTPKTLYERTTVLPDGNTLLATWENYSPEPPNVYFPIYKSTDQGRTWSSFSKIVDTVNGWGLRYQPFLYVLPTQIGSFPAGTLLAAGNSIPTDLSKTKIDIYASKDSGKTWSFVSSVASGGKAVPNNGETPVWEPFLMVYNNQIICYYSDQRNPTYGQYLVHQTSSDLLSWSGIVTDVSYPVYTARPGMTTVARMPNGKYIMTYEYGGGPLASGSTSYQFPIYYKISADPTKFGSVTGIPLIATDGTQPTSSPYITWSSAGGANGTLIVNANSDGSIFTNKKLGDSKSWVKVGTPSPAAYTRSLLVLPDPSKVLIGNGGVLNGNNHIRVDVIALV